MEPVQPDDRHQEGAPVSSEGQEPLSEESVATKLSPEERQEKLIQETCQHYFTFSSLYRSPFDVQENSSRTEESPLAKKVKAIVGGSSSSRVYSSEHHFSSLDRELSPYKNAILQSLTQEVKVHKLFVYWTLGGSRTAETQEERKLMHLWRYSDIFYGADFVQLSSGILPESIVEAVNAFEESGEPLDSERAYHSVVRSAVECMRLIEGLSAFRHSDGNPFVRWLDDPMEAQKHIPFLVDKALNDEKFFREFPYVMGDSLVRVPQGKLVEKEHFPKEWLRSVDGHCGTSTPTFAYRDFGWGLGVSTHFEMVLD